MQLILEDGLDELEDNPLYEEDGAVPLDGAKPRVPLPVTSYPSIQGEGGDPGSVQDKRFRSIRGYETDGAIPVSTPTADLVPVIGTVYVNLCSSTRRCVGVVVWLADSVQSRPLSTVLMLKPCPSWMTVAFVAGNGV